MIKQLQFGKKKVFLHLPENAGENTPIVYLPEMKGDILNTLLTMDDDHIFDKMALAVVCVSNWFDDLTPWPAPPAFGKVGFQGKFDAFFDHVVNTVMPTIESRYPVAATPESRAVAGYSLGGLASVLFFLQSDKFAHLASMSGSFWYPNLFEHVNRLIDSKSTCTAYFSLGDAEQSPHGIFSAVNQNHADMAGVFTQKFGEENVFFEWNTGDHTTDVPQRIYKGLCHLAQQLTQ